MAVLLGFISPSAITLLRDENVNLSNDIETQTVPTPFKVFDSLRMYVGPLITHWPVEAMPRVITGSISAGYVADYYYRVHVNPSITDIGNLVGNREVTVTLWNAFFETKTINFLSSSGADGIVITTGYPLPYSLPPLRELPYVFTVTPDGPAIIDATYQWSIEGSFYQTKIIGKRFVVIPFKPNYRSQGPVETFEWKTQILRKKTGKEQRISNRLNPRRNFSYSITTDKTDSQWFKMLAWGWMNRAYAMPIWTDTRFTQSANAIGSNTIFFTTTYYNYLVGGSLVLYASSTDYEVLEIKEVYSDRVVTKTNMTKAWPKGSEVYPIIIGHLPTAQPISRKVGDIFEATLSFETDPATTNPFLPIQLAPTGYAGLEVLTMQPNWIKDINDSYKYDSDKIDNDTGPITWYVTEDVSGSVRNYSWLLKNRLEIYDFKAFLRRNHGRLKTFWVPSWAHDFDLIASITNLQTSLRVFDNGFRLLVGVDPAHDRIMIRLKNGTTFYRQIISVGVDGAGPNTVIGIDSALGVSVAPSDIDYICFLDRCRMASDTIDLPWHTNEVVTVETKFESVLV